MFLFVSQAEEGIREWSVTGVQTCALPISRAGRFDFVDISKKSNRPARVSFGGRPGFASEAGAPPKLLNVLFQNVEAGAAVPELTLGPNLDEPGIVQFLEVM